MLVREQILDLTEVAATRSMNRLRLDLGAKKLIRVVVVAVHPARHKFQTRIRTGSLQSW